MPECILLGNFRRAKGAVKLHTLLDVKTAIPVFMYITPASVHDVNGLDQLTYEKGAAITLWIAATLILGGCLLLIKHGGFFVIRAKIIFNLQGYPLRNRISQKEYFSINE